MLKRPVFWIIAAAVIACAVLAVCFLTDKPEEVPEQGEVTEWFDDHYLLHSDAFEWPDPYTTDAFPGVRFILDGAFLAEKDGSTTVLVHGTPESGAYFCDLTGDGKPELCVSVSVGSGLTDEHICVYDYARGEQYILIDRGNYDYKLVLQDGKLVAEKRIHSGAPGTGPLVSTGRLMIKGGILTMENAEKTEVKDWFLAQGYVYGYTGYTEETLPPGYLLVTSPLSVRRSELSADDAIYMPYAGFEAYSGHTEGDRTVFKRYVQFREDGSVGKKMTLDDLEALSAKGETLSVSDFAGYAGSEIGSGMDVKLYHIPYLNYYLIVSSAGSIYAAELVHIPTGDRSDIRKEDPEAFWKRHSVDYIEDETVTKGIPTSDVVEVFWEEDGTSYVFSSLKSEYVYVVMRDGSRIPIKEALASGLISASSLYMYDVDFTVTP